MHADFEHLPQALLERYVDEIGNLVDAHIQQKHMFFAGRKICEMFSKIPGLSRRQVAVLITVKEKFSEYKNIVEFVKKRKVVYVAGLMHTILDENVEMVDIATLRDPRQLEKVSVLVENSIYDAFVLEHLVNAWAECNGQRISWLKVKWRHCGGTGFNAVLKEVFAEKCPFLCIVDTDKHSPHGNPKGTARLVETIMKAAGYEETSSLLLLTPGREIENLIPPSIIDEWIAQNQENEGLRSLRRAFPEWPYLRATDWSFYRYLDLKVGFKDLSALPAANRDERAHVQALITRVGQQMHGVSEQLVQNLKAWIENDVRSSRRRQRTMHQKFCTCTGRKDTDILIQRLVAETMHSPDRYH